MTAQPWICGSCRSINQPREGRCYHCRTPRELVEADLATLLVAGAGSKPIDVVRPTGTYRPSGELAIGAQILIAAALVVTVAGAILGADLVTRVLDGQVVAGTAPALQVGLVGGLGLVVAAGALVVFAFWLSRVVGNVPAVGLGWTNVTPTQAIYESLIPGVNLYRVPAVLRDVTERLEPAGRGEALLVAAWLGLVGGVLLPRVASWGIVLVAGSIEDFVGLRLLAGQLGLGLTIVGGVFLIALIGWVETRMEARAGTPAVAVTRDASAQAPAAVAPAAVAPAAVAPAAVVPAAPDPGNAPPAATQPALAPPAPTAAAPTSAAPQRPAMQPSQPPLRQPVPPQAALPTTRPPVLAPTAHWTDAIRRRDASQPSTPPSAASQPAAPEPPSGPPPDP